jgi:anti-sigma factor RsiW
MQTWACERAREAASLSLDGELSQLESAFLERHLRRCAACGAFAVELRGVAEELRAAPLVPLSRAIELPLRRRAALGARRIGAWTGAAAATIAAAAALLAVMVLPAQQRQGTPVPQVAPSNNDDLRELHQLRMAQMKPKALTLARVSPRGPEL